MTDLKFYTNPQSRGQIVRWMLEEVGQPYDTEILDYATTLKGDAYAKINPMQKIPAIVHDGNIVTEVAAICLYLADAFPAAGLAPPPAERADYYRWTFFAAGPIEAAFTNKSVGWEPDAAKQRMFGYGSFERAVDTLEQGVTGKRFIAGDKFSAADVVVGSQIGFMLMFKLLEPRPAFTSYIASVTDRDAWRRGKQLDQEAAETMSQQAS
ncbi:glutathione S-transferase N-terminal domain-containing protein [Sphingomonas sp.]|uniref:glutathione S-transferase family protein n=1 Tax=Sphingomonas sp. TaxID=28214 RepID=UPI0025E20D86|nr:glutathione S-transferase N-terminal domain-containing protein [Sphingomonas sp.]